MKDARKGLVLTAVLFLTICSVHGSIILDFTGAVGRTSLRMVAFDSQRQALLHYETLPTKPFKRPLWSFMSSSRPQKNSDPELSYVLFYDGNDRLTIAPPKQAVHRGRTGQQYLVLANCSLQTQNLDGVQKSDSLGKSFWTSRPIKECSPADLMRKWAPREDRGMDLPCIKAKLHEAGGDRPISELTCVEKGHLGELITRLTMFSFGYDFFPSQYLSNQGMDAMFLSFAKDYLLFSQSKFGSSAQMATTVIQNELSEKSISKRLALMGVCGSAAVKESQVLAYQFIENWPGELYKMAQCVYNCGLADLVIKPFDEEQYRALGPHLYSAKPEEKVAGVRSILRCYEPTEIGQLELALSAIRLDKIPRHQLLASLLKAGGVPEDQISSVIHIMDMPLEEDEE